MAKNQNQYTKSELFTVMNRIRKEQNLSLKEAYAEAKKILDQKYSSTGTDKLADQLMAKMKTGYVQFTFVNRHGKQITTTGTLDMSRVPVTRKVEGSQKPKSENNVVFYDGRHGVYRQFDRTKVVSMK